MILQDLMNIKYLETKKEKAYELDKIAKRGEVYSKLLHIIFDKDIRFYIDTNKIKIEPELPLYTDLEIDTLLYDLLHMLGKGEFRGNEGIIKCKNFIDKAIGMIDDDQECIDLFFGILDNKTRLGIGATDINKYCEYIKIKQFEVMYALRWDKAKVDWNKQYVIQPKIDGNRMIVEKGEDYTNPLAYSRGGELITSVNHIIDDLKMYLPLTNYMIDGEVENGTLEETASIRRKKKQAEDAIYTIFGIYDFKEWKSSKHTDTYEDILERTTYLMKNFPSKNIKIIPSYYIHSKSEEGFNELVQKYFYEFLSLGYEGYVLKTLDHVYQPSSGTRRSSDWVKGKPKDSTEGIILGIEEAKGEGRGMVGNFKVQWLDIVFDVSPSNMKHNMRKLILENKEDYLGGKVSFFHQGVSKYGVPRNAYAEKIRVD